MSDRPLTPEQLAEDILELKELHAAPKNDTIENYRMVTNAQMAFYYGAHRMLPGILAEVDRLTEERDAWKEGVTKLARERDEERARADRLTEELNSWQGRALLAEETAARFKQRGIEDMRRADEERAGREQAEQAVNAALHHAKRAWFSGRTSDDGEPLDDYPVYEFNAETERIRQLLGRGNQG